MATSYNLRSPAVKRLMKEAQELRESTELYYAQPLEDNLFEWHFTIRGPDETDFEGGIYHGRIILPTDYPMKPPNIVLLTPNGRFEVGTKVCLSISGYHPETWQPSWSIRTALLALIGFYPSPSNGAIGGLDYNRSERQLLAKRSVTWKCETCGEIARFLKPHVHAPKSNANVETTATTEKASTVQEETVKTDNCSTSQTGDGNTASQHDAASSSNPTMPQFTASASQPSLSHTVTPTISDPAVVPPQFFPFSLPSLPPMAMPFPMAAPLAFPSMTTVPPGYPPEQVLAEWRVYYDRYLASFRSPNVINHISVQPNVAQLHPFAMAAFASTTSQTLSSDNTPSATPPSATIPSGIRDPPAPNIDDTPAPIANAVNEEAREREPAPQAQAGVMNAALTALCADPMMLLIYICILLIAVLASRNFLLAVLEEDDADEL